MCPVVCVASPTSVIIILNHMPGSRVFPEVFYMGGIHVNRISGNLWMAHRILINCTVLKLAFKSLSHLLFKIANSVWDTFSMQYSYEYVNNSIHYHSKNKVCNCSARQSKYLEVLEKSLFNSKKIRIFPPQIILRYILCILNRGLKCSHLHPWCTLWLSVLPKSSPYGVTRIES